MQKLTVLELNRLDTETYKKEAKIPLVVVLDNVRSLHNVGSVFRTSDAFRVQEILLCGITATPPNAEIHKTALGAEDSVDWQYFADTHQAVDYLQANGYTVLAVEQVQNSVSLTNVASIIKTNEKYAVVLGHEVKGVNQEIVDRCTHCIEIPQEGTKHSLNVSVAAGLIIWDIFKLLWKK